MINIPDEAVKFIILQRGLSKNPITNVFMSIKAYLPGLHQKTLGVQSILFRKQVKVTFNKTMQREYELIRPFLPARADSVLDIGCGVAGVEVLISRHYNNKIKIFLIDKTQIDKKVYYGFEERGSFYSSLPVAKRLLVENRVSENNIYLQEATEDNQIKFEENFDIVISLRSWGQHYPVSNYLDQVYDKLKPNGILILDIRKDTGGEDEIRERFGNCKVIKDLIKVVRVLVYK